MGRVGKEVWIVDDEPELAQSYSEYLGSDFTSRFFSSAEDAIRAFDAQESKPEVIVTDLAMPRLGGIEFMQKIRERSADCPVIVMSGNAQKDDLSNVINKKAFAYLEKPFHPDMLRNSVQKAFDWRALELSNLQKLRTLMRKCRVLEDLLNYATNRYVSVENAMFARGMSLGFHEARDFVESLSEERQLYKKLHLIQAELEELRDAASDLLNNTES